MTEQTLLLTILLVIISIGALAYVLFSTEENRARDIAKRGGRGQLGSGAENSSFLDGLFGREPKTAVDRLRRLTEEQKHGRQANLRARMMQAGLEMQPMQFLMVFHTVGTGVGAGVYFASGQLLFAAAAAIIVGFWGPRTFLARRISSRIRRFNEHFPGALDIIVRGVRSGMPVSESLKLVSTEAPAPVGPEFERIVTSITLGVTFEDALKQLAMRVPSTEVQFFRTVLSIQQKSGGNLAETLSNLSLVLRERKKMKKKVYALSSEARMSAIIIGSLPFIVGILVYLLRPDYIMILFNNPTGLWLLGGGMVWMCCGILMMRSMVRFEV
ncbi:MAG: type II secretion system F family protein [Neomegalonema sp.]|nr:type II secretion system F family protein [Neomegalonema sp.]